MMKTYQERANAWIEEGNTAREEGRRDAAIHAYREAIELVPAYGTLHMAIAALLLDAGRPAEAADAFRSAAAFAPEHVDAWTGLGKCELMRDHHEEALAAFETAREVDPQNPDACYYSALLLGMRGEIKEAEKRLYTALMQRPAWETQARREASLKPVFESSRRLTALGRPKKWWEFWK